MTGLASDPFVQMGVLAVVGAIVTRILLRRYPAWRLALQLLFFTALTALLHHYAIVPYEVAPDDTPIVERVFIAASKIIWWINVAWLLTGGARVFLVLERLPRESRLIQDLVVGVIYLSAGLSIVAYAFSAPVGTLIATSGVFAIILGLALQSTLADLFSGIALNVSSVYEVGDWIVLSDGTEGRVIETNWRATHLLNGSNDSVVLPNSNLAKAQLTNLSSPNRNHGVKLRVRVVPSQAPSAISEVMQHVLLSSNFVMAVPKPSIEIKSLDAQAIELELSFRVRDFETASAARHEVYDLIYRHTRAADLDLAQPRDGVILSAKLERPAAVATAPKSAALRLVEALPQFTSMTQAERATLAETMTRKTYRKGEVLAKEGAKLDTLSVIRTGVVRVSRGSEEGELELERLAPGDYFGETGLFGDAGEAGTIRALTSTVVYEIGRSALSELMKNRPAIADEICMILSRHGRMERLGIPAAHAAGDTSAVSALVSRIRQLFEVPRS